jgi:HlyD family secretion protein
VWIIGDDDPQPVPVQSGITDGQRTEILTGNIKAGDRVVTGTQAPAS